MGLLVPPHLCSHRILGGPMPSAGWLMLSLRVPPPLSGALITKTITRALLAGSASISSSVCLLKFIVAEERLLVFKREV